ncbi:MAG: DUF2997 domain-containing protein [Candidatus Eisenbacteria bacterium]|nr:DUF2997 domain-containing protein [Candidatus Eisenbacteria bacterium]
MSKTIKVLIHRDGSVRVDIQGIKGKTCTDYIRLLEEVLDAEAIESAYTPEYLESEVLVLDETDRQELKGMQL